MTGPLLHSGSVSLTFSPSSPGECLPKTSTFASRASDILEGLVFFFNQKPLKALSSLLLTHHSDYTKSPLSHLAFVVLVVVCCKYAVLFLFAHLKFLAKGSQSSRMYLFVIDAMIGKYTLENNFK